MQYSHAAHRSFQRHETDVTISDYAADLRAPTPSAAAELAVFDYAQFLRELEARKRKLTREMMFALEQSRQRLDQDILKVQMYHPQNLIREKRLRLADMEDELNRLLIVRIEDAKRRNQMAADCLSRAMERKLEQDKKRLAVLSGTLWGLSPLKKLSQGYGFVTDEAGKRLASVQQVSEGSRIHVQVTDGKLTAQVVDKVTIP